MTEIDDVEKKIYEIVSNAEKDLSQDLLYLK